MDLQEAVAILESSLNIDCSYPAAIKEIDARMMVAEVAKAELEREKGCEFCRDGRFDIDEDCFYYASGDVLYYDDRYDDFKIRYCPNCGRKLV